MENEEKKTVNDIIDSLCSMGKSFNLAVQHSMFGVDTSDIMEDLNKQYYDEIIPAMIVLSDKEQKSLIRKINEKLKLKDPDLNLNLLRNAKDYLKNHPAVDVMIKDETEKKDLTLTELFTRICCLGRDYKNVKNQKKSHTDTKEILNNITKEYDETIVPTVKTLSDEDKKELLGRIEEVLAINFEGIDPIFFNRIKIMIEKKEETAKVSALG